MKIFKIFVSCVILFLLERVLFAHFAIFSLTPWAVFTFCILSGVLSNDAVSPLVMSLACGIATDLTSGGNTGTAALSFVALTLIVHFFVAKVFQRNIRVVLISVFLAGVGGEMLYFAMNGAGANGFSLLWTLWHKALPLALLDTLFAFIIYPVAKRLFAERRKI